MAYVEQALTPILRPGDIVVMDNIGAHKVTATRGHHARAEQMNNLALVYRQSIPQVENCRRLSYAKASGISDQVPYMLGPLVTRRMLLGGLAVASVGLMGRRALAGSVRRLTLERPATGDVANDVPFWWHDAPYEDGLAELDWLMRDVRARRVKPIDLRLYYLLAMVQAEFGGRPIIITSGYRTKGTNDRLRQQDIDAARNSFHLRGQAADIQIPGVPPARLAALGSTIGLGGVGIYASFVHLDTGPYRFWRK